MFKLAQKRDNKIEPYYTAGLVGLGTALIGNGIGTFKVLSDDMKSKFEPPISKDLILKLKNHLVKNPDNLVMVGPGEGGPNFSFYADKDLLKDRELEKYFSGLKKDKFDLLKGKNIVSHSNNEAILAHELGHASFYENKSKTLKKVLSGIRFLNTGRHTAIPAVIGYGLGGKILADDDHSVATKALTAGAMAALALPTLIDEGIASYKGAKALNLLKGTPYKSSLKTLLPAFLTYASLPIGGILGGYSYEKIRNM